MRKLGHSCGKYHGNISIVNDTITVIVSDTPSCGFTYGHYSENSICVIYTPREGNTRADIHLRSSYFYSTGERLTD